MDQYSTKNILQEFQLRLLRPEGISNNAKKR